MDPITIGALVKGGSALGKYAYNKWFNKQKNFDDTPGGRRMKLLAKEGVYNPRVTRTILGQVGKATGSTAQIAKTNLKGNLIASGMENSIAGQGRIASIDSQRMEKIGDVAADLATKNEMSKVEAQDKYTMAKQGYQDRIKAMEQENTGNLVSGLINTAGSYVMGKAQQTGMENIDFSDPSSLTQWVASQPDQAKAMSQLRDLAYSSYYGGKGASAVSEQDILGLLQKDPARAGQTIQILNELGMLPKRILNYLKAGE